MPYTVKLPPASALEYPRAASPIPEKPVIVVTSGDRPSPNIVNSAGRAELPKRATRTDPAPWEQLAHPTDPRERLTSYLDAWAGMDEAAWPEASVRALFDDIMDLFREYPEADAWFRAWRAAHPERRLA